MQGFISKFAKHVVTSQLNDHVSLNGLENVRQSAYKLGHSTESALLSIKNDVQQRLILLIMIRYLILLAPGLVLGGLSSIGSRLLSHTVFSALRLGQFYLMPKSYCMVCLKALFWGQSFFTPQPLRAVGVLFSPMVFGWAGGRREIVCPGCISETVRCRKLILGRDIG